MLLLVLGMIAGAMFLGVSLIVARTTRAFIENRKKIKEKEVVEQTLRFWDLDVIPGEPLNESRRRIRQAIKGRAPWDDQSTGKSFEAGKTIIAPRPNEDSD